MSLPIPEGTRDALPDEMHSLRIITGKLSETFRTAGYGEIYTPTMEYQSTLALGDARVADGAYKLFDEHGEVLVFRPDMTIPIARVVGTKYAQSEVPLRFFYMAHTYREERGRPKESLEAGIELVGSSFPVGTVEVLRVLCDALDAVGLEHYRIGIGDAALYPSLLKQFVDSADARAAIMHELVTLDFVGLTREIRALELDPLDSELLIKFPQLRGYPKVLQAERPEAMESLANLQQLDSELPANVRDRAIYDLGLCRRLGYYTGTVFEVYDPACSVPLGGGGHYDELTSKFGRDLPAVGFSLYVEPLHAALYGEGRL